MLAEQLIDMLRGFRGVDLDTARVSVMTSKGRRQIQKPFLSVDEAGVIIDLSLANEKADDESDE